MSTVAAIVEGDGEVQALPILLRRLNEWQTPDRYVQVQPPIRVNRDRFLNRNEELRRHLLLAAAKCGDEGWVLVLLDADDDCPADLGAGILDRARQTIPHRRVSLVLAKREFEAWFIASAQSLDGHRRFSFHSGAAIEAETPRDAKGWMAERMSDRTYRPTTDQPAFTARMDLQQAFDHSRSFRKLCSEWIKQTQTGPSALAQGT